jgi:hypothetical protein
VEGRALIHSSLGSTLPSMPMDDPLNSSQSYARTFKLFREVQTLKHTEELVCIPHIKARAIVLYEHLYLAFLRFGTPNLDFGSCSRPRELDRIGKQIR